MFGAILVHPLAFADAAIRVLVDQRPDGPALWVFLLEARLIPIAKPILPKDRVLPTIVEVTHHREVEISLVLANDRLRAHDHRRKECNDDQKAHEAQRDHRQLAALETLPRFAPEAPRDDRRIEVSLLDFSRRFGGKFVQHS